MNIELLKGKMAKFLSETSANDLIKELEKAGYEFVDSGLINWDQNTIHPFEHLRFNYITPKRKQWFWQKKVGHVATNCLTSNYSGSFFA